MEKTKLHALKFALAAGLYGAFTGFSLTAAALLKVPGLLEFAESLEKYYGPWGYQISYSGLLVGSFYGFQEGFVHFGLFALLYNRLLK